MSDTKTIRTTGADAADQRVGPLIRLPGMLREFGVHIDVVLEGTGVKQSAFDDLENRVPFQKCAQVLERSATMTGCPHFGLLLGARSDHRDLGTAGQYLANAATLGDALTGFVGLQAVNSGGASVYLHRSGEHWVFGYGIYAPETVARDQIYPLIMAMSFNIVQRLTSGAVRPVEVLLPIHPPKNVLPYLTHLGMSLRFNQREAGVVLLRSALDAVIPEARPADLERLRQQIASRMPRTERVWSQRVSHAVRPLVLRGEPTTAKMAAVFGLNVRALSRRLESEGTTFQQILDRVRYSMARELLHITELTVGDISDALSYSYQSNFTEAFRRWSGVTPTAWRIDRRQG